MPLVLSGLSVLFSLWLELGMSTTFPVLHVWSDQHFRWCPLFVGVTAEGRSAVPLLRDQLGLVLIDVRSSDLADIDPDAVEADAAAVTIPAYAAWGFRSSSVVPAVARSTASVESSAVPVLYVWPDCEGVWCPLVVAVTDFGRAVAPLLRDQLAAVGINTWLHGLERDDRALISAAARLLPPPAGVGFIDPAPDGVIDDAWLDRCSPSH